MEAVCDFGGWLSGLMPVPVGQGAVWAEAVVVLNGQQQEKLDGQHRRAAFFRSWVDGMVGAKRIA